MKVFIGYDKKEHEAFEVCDFSIRTRSNLMTYPLVQSALRASGLYTRQVDEKASTEFSLTRFLTPHIAKQGFAVFCDCDFLFLTDINKILLDVDPEKAVSVVKHDYTPNEDIKMDGCQQHSYPRKNWSSLIVFNCDHPKVKKLTPNVVNIATPAYLHQFKWLDDDDIGTLPVGWNYLVDVYPENYPTIHALHYTLGGPWFPQYQNCGFATEWKQERYRLRMRSSITDSPTG